MHDDIPLTVGRATRVLAERIRPAVHPRSIPLEVAAHALRSLGVPPSGTAAELFPTTWE